VELQRFLMTEKKEGRVRREKIQDYPSRGYCKE
jgi:hypothetical protein